jgi:hypothetical protein
MPEPTHIGDVLTLKLESLRRTFDALPPEHDAEVERRETALRHAAVAQRTLDISPGRALRRDIEKLLAGLGDAELSARRTAACELTAKALTRKYAVPHVPAQTAKLVRAVEMHGSQSVLEISIELCDEPRDPRVRDIFRVLLARLHSREAASA